MPVPLKAKLNKTLPDDYELALKRNLSLRMSALKNPVLKQTLIDTFSEVIKEGWSESVDNVHSVSPKWYFPYFVTKQGKPRVVYDEWCSNLRRRLFESGRACRNKHVE